MKERPQLIYPVSGVQYMLLSPPRKLLLCTSTLQMYAVHDAIHRWLTTRLPPTACETSPWFAQFVQGWPHKRRTNPTSGGLIGNRTYKRKVEEHVILWGVHSTWQGYKDRVTDTISTLSKHTYFLQYDSGPSYTPQWFFGCLLLDVLTPLTQSAIAFK